MKILAFTLPLALLQASISYGAEFQLKHVAVGLYHTCGVVSDGSVRCIGSNSYGQLGKGGESDYAVSSGMGKMDINRRQSFPVVGIQDASFVSAGNMFTCAVRTGGKVSCWGQGKQGQLGDGKAADYSSTPVDVTGLTGVTAVGSGAFHNCALKSDGTVWCWGMGLKGSLGDGANAKMSATPVQVAGITGAKKLAVRGDYACVLASDNSVQCWGEPTSPRAFGTNPAPASKPVVVFPASEGAVDFAISSKAQCILNQAGKVRCKGMQFLGLLPGAKPNEVLKGIAEVPAAASAISEIILGDDSGIGTYICARLASGSVECMGGGRLGQLGNGKALDSETWVNVQGVAGAKKLFNGNAYVFAQLADGNLLGWGFNNNLGGVAGIGKMLNNVSTPAEPVKLVNSK